MRLALQLALAAWIAAPALGNPLPAPQPGTKRWIVTFKPTVKRDGRDRALAALGLSATAHIATDGNGDADHEFSAAVVDVPAERALTGLAAKSASSDVVSVERDVKVKWIEQAAVSFQATPLPSFEAVMGALKMPRPADFPQFSALAVRGDVPWGIQRVHAPAAWPQTEGAGVKIAIIDTGIDYTHPALAGKVDGGYSALKKSENPQDYMDDNGHGTHVSGTAAGSHIKGLVGVAPKARLYAVKVLDADGSGNLSDVIDGIVWAAKNGMQVANMSLGAPTDSDAMHRAVRYAAGMGVVIVAAAGNTGGAVGYPGAYPEVVTVAASDSSDGVASFSSRGPEVKFIAPGVDVVSARLGGGFVSFSGTSMATPHVSGLAALSVAQGWVGTNGPDGVLAQLRKAASPLPGLSAEQQGAGLIDAGKLTR
jgi:subtilisin family serine protease